jgi:hypothetical protein
MEGAPESVLIPPLWPLQVAIRFLFEESDLCRGLGGGGPGHQDSQEGHEDSEPIKYVNKLVRFKTLGKTKLNFRPDLILTGEQI